MQCPDCFNFEEVETDQIDESDDENPVECPECEEALVVIDLRAKLIEDLTREMT